MWVEKLSLYKVKGRGVVSGQHPSPQKVNSIFKFSFFAHAHAHALTKLYSLPI